MALSNDAMRMLQVRYPAYAAKWNELSAIPGLEAEFARGFSLVNQASYASDDDTSARTTGATGVAIMDKALNDASTNPVGFVKSNLLESMVVGNSDLATNQVKYLQQNNVPTIDINNLWQENIAKIEQGQRRSKEGISPGQLASLGLAVILPGVGSAIGGQLLAAGLLPVGTTVATATAVGTGLANAALQVAQGKSADEVLKGAVVGGAAGYVGGKVGDYLVGDAGTVKNLVTNTAANIVAGKNPEDAVIAGLANTGAGLAGGAAAGATGSAAAGQLAAGTTAGLLTGKTLDQSLAQGVSNIKLDSLIPGSVATVPTEQQVLAGQQDLMNQLAPYESTIPADTTASSFDTKDVINDGSGFSTTTTAPAIIDSGVINPATDVANVVGTDATQIDTTQTAVNTGVKTMGEDDEVIDYEGAGMSAGLSEYLADPEGATMYAGIQQALNLDPEGAAMSAGLSQAIQDYSTGTGLSVKDVVKFFKDNPNLAKAATSVISGGVGLFGTKLATDTATAAAKAAADAQRFKPVGVMESHTVTRAEPSCKAALVSKQ